MIDTTTISRLELWCDLESKYVSSHGVPDPTREALISDIRTVLRAVEAPQPAAPELGKYKVIVRTVDGHCRVLDAGGTYSVILRGGFIDLTFADVASLECYTMENPLGT
jgi:predicted transcriptional regulator